MPWPTEALRLSAELERRMALIEFNWFGENPKRHIKITAQTFDELKAQHEAMMDFLGEMEFPPLTDEDLEVPFEETILASVYESHLNGPVARVERAQPSQHPAVVSAVATKPAQRPAAKDVRCGLCGGAVYDEHKSQYWGDGLAQSGNPKPGWKCRDKNCGGKAWDQYDENHQWVGIGEWKS